MGVTDIVASQRLFSANLTLSRHTYVTPHISAINFIQGSALHYNFK